MFVANVGSMLNSNIFTASFALSSGLTALLLLGAIIAFRDVRHLLQGKLLIALSLSLAAHQFVFGMQSGSVNQTFEAILRVAAVPNVGLIWWFGLSLMRDDFRLDWRSWAGMTALCLAPAYYTAVWLGFGIPFDGAINLFGGVAPFAMAAHLVWVALGERNGDLIEERRKSRIWIAVAIAIATIVSVAAENVEDQPLQSLLRNGIAILPVVILLLLWLFSIPGWKLEFAQDPVVRPETTLDPKDYALHRKLVSAMEEEQLYLKNGLSIEELAEKLGVPAHQLRQLINARLGYRNFAAFLNGYRLTDAKRALADVERARETILAIAYESGFSSLQTFNRVFRDAEAMTPTEYRASALAVPSQD